MSVLAKHGTAIIVAILSLFLTSAPVYALYVVFQGDDVTWSNTQLGGGPVQPRGWVEVRNPPVGFTGDVFAPSFLSKSSVTYGTYTQKVTWGPQHLLNASKVHFTAGQVTDLNLIYYDAGNDRLLVVSGPPTANAVLVNTPEPPCVPWPGFPDLDFCGARVAVTITTSASQPPPGETVTIPPTPAPTYPAHADVNINGRIEFRASGGLSFTSPYTHLNPFGPYKLTGTLNWSIGNVDEPTPQKKRVWFSNVLLHHQASGQTTNGIPITAVGDDDYWVLGEPLSWIQMRAYTLANINTFCASLIGVGICDQDVNFQLTTGAVAFGIFASSNAAGVGQNFLVDLTQITGLAQLSTTFTGSPGVAHRAVTVPVLEVP
jgi:hypothetical protein